MKKNALAILALLLALSSSSFAQTHEAGGLLGVGFEQKIVRNFHFSTEGEVRFNGNFTHFNRFRLIGSFDYAFWQKRFKLTVGGSYLLYNQEDYWENRGRVFASLGYTQKIRQFALSYRVRVQCTFYDEVHGHHKFTPKTYLRNRLQLEYKFVDKPVKLYASGEFFLRLYKKSNYFIDEVRTIVGVVYKIDAKNSLDFFFRANNEVQVANPQNIYYIGISYTFEN